MYSTFIAATGIIMKNGMKNYQMSMAGSWCLNMPEATQYDFKKARLNRYLELMEIPEWRTYKPFHLFKKIDAVEQARLPG